MSLRSLLASSALVGMAVAQSTSVTSMFLYGSEGKNIVASVVSAAPQATTYFIQCAAGTDGTDCGFGLGVNFTFGASTMELHYTDPGAFTEDATCNLGSQTATCTETDAGDEANFPGISTASMDISDNLVPVTITAGLDALASASTAEPPSSATAGATQTNSDGQQSASATGTSTSGSQSSATQTSSGAVSSATASTGAAARANGAVIVAGLAGILGVAVVL